jgi:uncharacterized protein YaaN involved in tellurite resistance
METQIVNAPKFELNSIAGDNLLANVTFSDEMKSQAVRLAENFSIETVAEAGVYGNSVMQDFNQSVSSLLQDVRLGDLGKIGDIVAGVEEAAERMRLRALYEELQAGTWRHRLSKIPLIGGMLSTAKYFLEQRDSFLALTDQMERGVIQRQQGIRDHNRKLDALLTVLEGHYRDLAVHIIAGEKILKAGKERYDRLHEQAKAAQDPLLFAQLHRESEKLQAFDVRLASLKIAYVKSPTSALQTQIGQSAQRMTVEHLSNILDFVIPNLKLAVVQAEGMVQLSEARKQADGIQKTADAIDQVGIDMLRENYLGGKRDQGATFDRAAKLGETIQKISNIVSEGRLLDADNARRRQEAERVLIAAMQQQRDAISAHVPAAAA